MMEPFTSVAEQGLINNFCNLLFFDFPPLSICLTPFFSEAVKFTSNEWLSGSTMVNFLNKEYLSAFLSLLKTHKSPILESSDHRGTYLGSEERGFPKQMNLFCSIGAMQRWPWDGSKQHLPSIVFVLIPVAFIFTYSITQGSGSRRVSWPVDNNRSKGCRPPTL